MKLIMGHLKIIAPLQDFTLRQTSITQMVRYKWDVVYEATTGVLRCNIQRLFLLCRYFLNVLTYNIHNT